MALLAACYPLGSKSACMDVLNVCVTYIMLISGVGWVQILLPNAVTGGHLNDHGCALNLVQTFLRILLGLSVLTLCLKPSSLRRLERRRKDFSFCVHSCFSLNICPMQPQ